MNDLREFCEPVDVLVLFLVPVFLLALKRKWRACDNEINKVFGYLSKQYAGIAAEGGTVFRDIGRFDTKFN